jgi:hypothetical protein
VVPPMDHVFVIVMENHTYGQVIGSADAPYVNSLLPTSGLASKYYAVAHGSLPNYLALTSGRTDAGKGSNIADSLERAGKTWKAYEEGMPSACYSGDSAAYLQVHNPFLYYSDIQGNSARCKAHDVPYPQLATDLKSDATTPNFAFIAPDSCHDMQSCSVATGDAWLSAQVPQILASPAFASHNSMLVLTWAQDDASGNNQVPTILLGRGVTANAQIARRYDHYSTLRTVEAAFGLPALTAADAAGPSFGDFFALSDWTRLGGQAASGPNATSWGASREDVFTQGYDGRVYQDTRNGSSWSGWTGLGGLITKEPAVASWSSNRIDLFARGQDTQVWHSHYDGSSWSGWEPMGGIINYAPAATTWGKDRLDVFAAAYDGTLNHMYWNGSAWSSWEPVGAGFQITSRPAAVSWAPGRVDVFARGVDGQMWHIDWSSDHWSAWEPLGGQFSSGPTVASCSQGRLSIYGVGNDGMIWAEYWRNGWSGWQAKGWPASSSPGATCVQGSTNLELVNRAPDGTVVEITGKEG